MIFATGLTGSQFGGLSLNDTAVTKGSLTLSGSNTYTGVTNVYNGTLSIPATGAVTTNGSVFIATNAGNSGSLTVDGGTLSVTNGLMVWDGSGTMSAGPGSNVSAGWITLGQNTGTGIFTQTGGTVEVRPGNHLYIGYGGGASGTYNLQDGTLSIGADLRNDSGTADFEQTGGTLTANYLRIGLNGGSHGLFNVTAGTATIGTEADFGRQGTGTLSVGGTASVTLPNLFVGCAIGQDMGGNGTVTVSGAGLLTVNGAVTTGGRRHQHDPTERRHADHHGHHQECGRRKRARSTSTAARSKPPAAPLNRLSAA